jgi:hypothetical protein
MISFFSSGKLVNPCGESAEKDASGSHFEKSKNQAKIS